MVLICTVFVFIKLPCPDLPSAQMLSYVVFHKRFHMADLPYNLTSPSQTCSLAKEQNGDKLLIPFGI